MRRWRCSRPGRLGDGAIGGWRPRRLDEKLDRAERASRRFPASPVLGQQDHLAAFPSAWMSVFTDFPVQRRGAARAVRSGAATNSPCIALTYGRDQDDLRSGGPADAWPGPTRTAARTSSTFLPGTLHASAIATRKGLRASISTCWTRAARTATARLSPSAASSFIMRRDPERRRTGPDAERDGRRKIAGAPFGDRIKTLAALQPDRRQAFGIRAAAGGPDGWMDAIAGAWRQTAPAMATSSPAPVRHRKLAAALTTDSVHGACELLIAERLVAHAALILRRLMLIRSTDFFGLSRPKFGAARVLAGIDDGAADGAGAGEEIEQRLAVAPAHRALQRGSDPR